jgi:predicted DCC family thiol-disulfide oxidoreductase YuxK
VLHHPNGARSPTDDPRYVGRGKVAEQPEQHDLRLLGRQRPGDQIDRPTSLDGLHRLDLRVPHPADLRQPLGRHGVRPLPGTAASEVEHPPPCDRERERPQVLVVASEPRERTDEVEPGIGGEVFGLVRLERPQVAEDARMDPKVELLQRADLTAARIQQQRLEPIVGGHRFDHASRTRRSRLRRPSGAGRGPDYRVAVTRGVLLYDEDCGFCRWSVDRLLRWDRRGHLRAVAIQSPEGDRLLSDLPNEGRLASWHLVTPDGRRFSGGAAAAPLARLLPFGAPIAILAETFPATTDRAYRWVARHRDPLGRRLGEQACAVDPAARHRADAPG